MEEAARVSGETEGMVECPKLGGMGEREYLFNNAYDGECRKVKRDCCVLGEPEVVPVGDTVLTSQITEHYWDEKKDTVYCPKQNDIYTFKACEDGGACPWCGEPRPEKKLA